MKSFTELEAWQIGLENVKTIYRQTDSFPPEEKFGLTSQLRRASVSVLANLAEGFSRKTSADKQHKYVIAKGERSEIIALMHICRELQFINSDTAESIISQTQKTAMLISGLIKRFKS